MLSLLAKSSQSHPRLGHSPVGRLTRPWFESIPSGTRQLFPPATCWGPRETAIRQQLKKKRDHMLFLNWSSRPRPPGRRSIYLRQSPKNGPRGRALPEGGASTTNR